MSDVKAFPETCRFSALSPGETCETRANEVKCQSGFNICDLHRRSPNSLPLLRRTITNPCCWQYNPSCSKPWTLRIAERARLQNIESQALRLLAHRPKESKERPGHTGSRLSSKSVEIQAPSSWKRGVLKVLIRAGCYLKKGYNHVSRSRSWGG